MTFTYVAGFLGSTEGSKANLARLRDYAAKIKAAKWPLMPVKIDLFTLESSMELRRKNGKDTTEAQVRAEMELLDHDFFDSEEQALADADKFRTTLHGIIREVFELPETWPEAA